MYLLLSEEEKILSMSEVGTDFEKMCLKIIISRGKKARGLHGASMDGVMLKLPHYNNQHPC